MKESCLFTTASFGKNLTSLLVDTGSPVCLLSKGVGEKIGIDLEDLDETRGTFNAVNGGSIKIFGSTELEFLLEGSLFSQKFIIADIPDMEGILGMDFLEKYEVSIQVSKLYLEIGDQKVKLQKAPDKTCSRVRVTKQVVIPPCSEMLIDGLIEGGKPGYSEALVEPAATLGKEGLLCARTLVNVRSSVVTISVINVNDRPVTVPQSKTIGTLQTFQNVHSVTPNTQGDNSNMSSLPDHLKVLIEGTSDKLSKQQKKQLEQLIHKYQDIFVGPDNTLGRTQLVQHKIDTGDTTPFKIPMRRQPISQKPIIENELDKMLQQDIIEPSESPWSSPILLVTKKDGSIRFCIDFRKLNSVTRKDAYPLPRIDDSLERLGGSKWFQHLI